MVWRNPALVAETASRPRADVRDRALERGERIQPSDFLRDTPRGHTACLSRIAWPAMIGYGGIDFKYTESEDGWLVNRHEETS